MEQRARQRSRVWLPIRLQSDAFEAIAVTYDASDRGVMVLAPAALAVGAAVTLTFMVPSNPPRERTATGHVVRAGSNEDDPHGLWPHRIAVALDEPVEALGPELLALAQEHPLHADRKEP